jgi:hypothetical protein
MMLLERTSTEARGSTRKRVSQGSVRLLEALFDRDHGQEVRPIRRWLVECLRQSILTGNYLTPAKIDAAVERLR